ncbi:TetR/AcrR family transcriptional regulator [Nonomuraea sp. K274]|uniref:TetR/AcrR family transcriptional regulator n=1 Tax=Nonomuraea cypriaca TaxID=1187855 RepID=A0A931EZQ9_9ACTN|nr:TetR/AcrR family transcriptional regulator [Nonomuraea cypriaca]MBF8186426.1 TetR/AcrR family transcriptional regulator [Nonomuraea cypriaca]
MTLDSAATPRTSRGRRASRPTGDDRELDILTTAAKLLQEHALSEISIDDLARGAGISRPTFYFYFRSKDAVLLTLLDRVTDEIAEAVAGTFDRLREDPVRYWRECLVATYTTFGTHRSVLAAAVEAGPTSEEVRRWRAGMKEIWITRTTQAIEAERGRGAAPPGPRARDLAIALNAMNDSVFYSTLTGDEPAVPASDVVEVLLNIWLTTIYQTARPALG